MIIFLNCHLNKNLNLIYNHICSINNPQTHMKYLEYLTICITDEISIVNILAPYLNEKSFDKAI